MNKVPIPNLTLYFQKYLFNALRCFTAANVRMKKLLLFPPEYNYEFCIN
jgi:hypothetical protein